MRQTYKIVRHRFKGRKTTIKTGLTLKEAQEHCQRKDTRDQEHDPPAWFDVFTREK